MTAEAGEMVIATTVTIMMATEVTATTAGNAVEPGGSDRSD
jgi:hypothetical protein